MREAEREREVRYAYNAPLAGPSETSDMEIRASEWHALKTATHKILKMLLQNLSALLHCIKTC